MRTAQHPRGRVALRVQPSQSLYDGPQSPLDPKWYERTPAGAILQAPDAFYLPGGRGWVRVDAKTFACEWLPVDVDVYHAGQFGGRGISGRYGPVAWGKEFCRLVAAHERPAGALEAKLPGAPGIDPLPVLWADGRPTPSAEMLVGAPIPHWGGSPATQRETTGPATAPAAMPVLSLAAAEPQDSTEGRYGLLPRELARQAFLIAARDGLGLSTRDQTLQEPTPAGAVELDSQTLQYPRQGLRFRVGRRGDTSAPYLINDRIPIGNDSEGYAHALDYTPTITELERLSRGEFVDALKKAGLGGRGPARRVSGTGLPDTVERHLADLSFTSQFAAVREAHATIRQAGESPALLGALARGYANLGQLTDFLWNASHRAFTARSLLYAERMVAADPASADARYHRAYARALAGLHAAALADLDGADDRAKQANATAPAWAGLVRMLCRYETVALRDASRAGDERASLASYFSVLTEQLNPSTTYLTDLGQAAARANPYCFQILDRIDRHASASSGNPLGPSVLAEDLVAHLPAIESLPEGVRRAIPQSANDLQEAAPGATLTERLVEAGEVDTGEPSLAALGRMVQEHQFVNVQRHAWHMVYQFGADAGDYVAANRPLVAGHPYRGLVESYAFKAGRQPQDVLRALEGLTPFDMEYQERLFLARLDDVGQSDTRRVRATRDRMRGHIDDTAYDLERLLVEWRRRPVTPAFSAWMLSAVRRAETVSPSLPELVAVRARLDWKSVEPRVVEIERESGNHPAVSRAMAEHYLHAGRRDDAEHWLRRYVAIGHDAEGYRMLARCRLAGGDEAGWLEVLDGLLRQEENGLGHARVRVEISQHFMSQGKYDRAAPYARDAAASGAGWAMLNAAECYEGLGRWDEAERWVRRESERYDRPMAWYLWCVRTGHGDQQAAEAIAAEYVRRTARAADPIAATDRGLFYLAQGRSADALAVYQPAVDGSGSPFAGLHAALLYDAAHDPAARDAALEAVVRRGPAFRDLIDGKPRAHFVALASLFRKALADPAGDARLDRTAVEALLKPLGSGDRLWTLYFLGRFEDLRGHAEAATDYYRRCEGIHGIHEAGRVLAFKELRKRGIEPKPPPPDDPEKQDAE